MKKSKFIVGLSAAFISAVALMSCSGAIRARDHVVLTIDGEEYTAEELFGSQKTPAAAEAKFNAVYRVAIRHYFKNDPQGIADMADITNDTKIEINRQKVTAQENADKNGTKYADEWQKILDSNNVEDEDELYSKFEYDKQKAKFEDRLYENNYATLREGGKLHSKDGKGYGEEIDGYLKKKQPYHVRHILVKLKNAKGPDKTHVEITADEANLISLIVRDLAEGKDFGEVASLYSKDEGSAKNYGDLGIMDRDTSFVNDFKLGTYMYESFYGSSTTATAKAGLGLSDTTEDTAGYFANEISKLDDPTTTADSDGLHGIGQIPLEAALLLGEDDWTFKDSSSTATINGMGMANIDYDSQEFSKAGEDVKSNPKYFPRNVIFNKYFNKHNLMVITPRRLPIITNVMKPAPDESEMVDISKTYKAQLETGMEAYLRKVGDIYTDRTQKDKFKGVTNTIFATLKGFNRTPKNSDTLNAKLFVNETGTADANDNKVLRDEKGRVIFVFRSGSGSNANDDSGYQGIHFVVIERSPFIADEKEEGHTSEDPTTLEQYYTEYYPGQVGGKHPTYSDGKTPRLTYTSYFEAKEPIELKARADEIKNKLKACDPNLNIYIYKYLTDENRGDSIKFTERGEAEVKADIENWITYTKFGATKIEEEEKWNDTWKDYCYSLKEQQEIRGTWETTISEGVTAYHSFVASDTAAILYAMLKGNDATDVQTIKALFGNGGVFHE